MAVYFAAEKPADLLAAFKKAIDEGHIDTWAYKENGDFYHDRPQWKDKAAMRPVVVNGQLQFGIIATEVTWPTYGVYHGRIIESFLTHFAAKLKDAARATPNLVAGLDSNTKKAAS